MAIQMLLIYKDKPMAFQKFPTKTEGYSNAFQLQGQANGFSKVPNKNWWLAIQMILIYKDKLMAFQKFPTKTDG